MPGPVSIGDTAPNFDLSSTEDALLMLKDEVVRLGKTYGIVTPYTSYLVVEDVVAGGRAGGDRPGRAAGGVGRI